MKLSKSQKVLISDVVIDRTRNVREQDDSTYKVDALMQDIAYRGQQTAALLEKVDGKYYPIQGFLRATAIAGLAAAGTINPATVSRNSETGEPIAGTGKPFTHIVADVYEGLTERERVDLLVDHGQRRGLRKHELFFALERLFDAGFSEKDIAVITFSLLEQHYPLTKKVEDTPEAKLAYYRGVIQMFKQAWRAPKVLRELWVVKLKENLKQPTKKDLFDGVAIFLKEIDSDKTNTLTKENPGPKFVEWWERLTAAAAEAAENGEARGKSVSMMTRGQVEDVQKGMESRIGKTMLSVVLNDGKVDRSKVPTLDGLLKQLEAAMTPEQKAVLDSCYVTA